MRKRDHACARVGERQHGLGRDPSVNWLRAPKLDPAALERHPRVDVCRVLAIRADDIVSGRPVQPLRKQGQAVRGAARQGDRIRRGVDEPADQLAHVVGLVLRLVIAIRPVENGLDQLFDGRATTLGHWRHARVVHVDVVLGQRDEVARLTWIHQTASSRNRTTSGCSTVM